MAFAIPVLRVQLRFVNCINKRKKKNMGVDSYKGGRFKSPLLFKHLGFPTFEPPPNFLLRATPVGLPFKI